MTHLHNEATKTFFRFMIPKPPTILGAHIILTKFGSCGVLTTSLKEVTQNGFRILDQKKNSPSPPPPQQH
jgi:hypothetical protein